MDRKPQRILVEDGLYIVSTDASAADGGAGIRARLRAAIANARTEPKPTEKSAPDATLAVDPSTR